jgi:hypothetical protein
MFSMQWVVCVTLLGVVGSPKIALADEKPAEKTTLAGDEARLFGKWSKSVTVDKKDWTYTFEFKKDGDATLVIESPGGGAVKTFTYEVIDLRGGRRVLALSGGLVFPGDSILVAYALKGDELELQSGKDVVNADLKGKWKRVEDKDE